MRRWVAVAGLGVALAAAATSARADTPTLSEVIEDAGGKPIIVAFSATWCEPCKQFKERILPQERVQEALAGVAYVEYDIDEAPGESIASAFEVTGVPTFVAVDDTGAERARLSSLGSAPADAFVDFVHTSTVLAMGAGAIDALLASGDAQGHLDAARWYAARGDSDRALELYDRAVELDSERRAPIGHAAAWEASELRAERDARQRTIDDAIDYVRAYPGTDRATVALARVALSDSPDVAVVEELLALHIDAASGPVQMHYIAYLALAAGAVDGALAAADELSRIEGGAFKGAFTRADVHHSRGEIDEALAAADEALAAARSDESKRRARELRRRIEHGNTTSPIVDRIRGYGSEYFAKAFEADPVEAKNAAREYDRELFMTFFRAQSAAFRAAAKACKRFSNDHHEVWVRLMLGPPNEPPTEVIVLEPGITGRLAQCLQEKLATIPLPVAPNGYAGEVNAPVHFHSRRRPPPEITFEDIAPLDQAFIAGAASAGVVDGVSAAGRAMLRVGRFDVFHGALTLDGAVGAEVGDDQLLYDARAMVGVGTGRDSASVGLTAGAGVSRAGNVLPRAFEIPAELFLIVSGDNVRGNMWIRSAWIFDADSRRGGATNAFLASDELSAGFMVRLPARSPSGVVLGAEYTEAIDKIGFTIFVGTSLDSLF